MYTIKFLKKALKHLMFKCEIDGRYFVYFGDLLRHKSLHQERRRKIMAKAITCRYCGKEAPHSGFKYRSNVCAECFFKYLKKGKDDKK